MFKFRFFGLVVISMMLIFGLSAGSALAKPNSVKVDSDPDCDPDREDNEITTDNIWVWLNINSALGCPNSGCTRCIELIEHNGGTVVCSGGLVFADDGCASRPEYLRAFLNDLCGVLANDLYTLLVHTSSSCASKLLGADSFSVDD